MARPLCMKRMTRERAVLEKANDDYFVHFKDEDLLNFDAYVIGPADTLYSFKFVKLRFEIPDRYPLVPPKCKFIQHSGGRIHPNLYVEGKVCLSILGTWPGEPWALAMTIETVLITVRSLLDNAPYKHEPGQRDKPAFNQYVQYSTWRSLLLDYVRKESELSAKAFLEKYISDNSTKMIAELKHQQSKNPKLAHVVSSYCGNSIPVNYVALIQEVTELTEQCMKAEEARQAASALDSTSDANSSKMGGKDGTTDINQLASDHTKHLPGTVQAKDEATFEAPTSFTDLSSTSTFPLLQDMHQTTTPINPRKRKSDAMDVTEI